MKNITKKQSRVFIIIFSLLIAIPFTIHFYYQIYPYEFEIIKKYNFSESSPRSTVYLQDINHDNTEEIILALQNLDCGFDYLLFLSFDWEILGQYNFSGKFPSFFDFSYYDIGKDGVDELFCFEIVKDSLFLNAIDITNDTFLFKKVFVLAKPENAKNNFWNIAIHDAKFIDMNDDGEKDFVFIVKTAFGDNPNGIYVFDFRKMRLINSFNIGCSGKIQTLDANNDGEEEMFVENYASCNLEKTGLHDNSVWYFPLNKKLELLKKPIEFGGFTSYLRYFFSGKKNYVFVSKGTINKNINGEIFNVNDDFSLSKIREIPFTSFVPLKYNNSNNFLLINSFSNKITLLNENLSLIKDRIPNHIVFDDHRILNLDIENDNQEEFILYSGENLYIYNQELEILAEFQSSESMSSGVKKIFWYNNEMYYSTNTEKNHYLFKIVRNQYYSSFFFLAFAGWLLLFGLLYLTYFIILYFLIYLNYFLHSFRKSNTALIILNSEGKINYINDQTYSLLHLSKQSKKKPAISVLLSDKTEILETITEARKTNFVVQNPFFYSTPEYQINGAVTATPFTLFKKITIGYLVEIENYTEAILLERTKIWAKSVLRIAHDIKTPLSSVSLGIQTIRNTIEGEDLKKPEIITDFDGILNELNRVRNLTKSFLKFINMEVINFQVVSVHTLVNETLDKFSQFFNSTDIQVNKDFTDKTELIWADPFQLGQLFQILIENAIDAVDGKGIISISTNVRDNETKEDQIIQIKFADTGCGVKPELKEKLFSPYITTKKDGTGIGLFIAKKITEDHKGKIYFENNADSGSVFVVEFTLINECEFNNIK